MTDGRHGPWLTVPIYELLIEFLIEKSVKIIWKYS